MNISVAMRKEAHKHADTQGQLVSAEIKWAGKPEGRGHGRAPPATPLTPPPTFRAYQCEGVEEVGGRGERGAGSWYSHGLLQIWQSQRRKLSSKLPCEHLDHGASHTPDVTGWGWHFLHNNRSPTHTPVLPEKNFRTPFLKQYQKPTCPKVGLVILAWAHKTGLGASLETSVFVHLPLDKMGYTSRDVPGFVRQP